ncbi:MAG TPA: hypothetical protein VMZ53_22690 [Kofleriaceae bacterium]|nr:hypothetical protein [Kofleriaceae bacterium]
MRSLFLLALTACGRLSFDGVDGHGDARRDGNGSDAPGDFCTAGASATCPAGALFCDGFETSAGPSFPKWDSTMLGNWFTGGAADPATQVDATGAPCRGAKSAHGHALGEAQIATLHEAITPRPPSLFLRAWFRIGGTSPESDIEMLGIHDTPDSQFINVGVMRGAQALGINVVGFASTAGGVESPATIVTDQWMCLELGIRFDTAGAGRIQLWLDDAPIADLDNVTTEATATLDDVMLGVVTGMPETGTFDVDFDEVAVATSHIGCN